MTASVRSRLIASAVAFALGFGLGNYGILMVARPDLWLWIVVSLAFMVTGAAGVMFADTSRDVSFWAVLGLEVLVVLTVVPLLWTFTVATAPAGTAPQALWPQDVTWRAFDGAIRSDILQDAALTSLLVSGLATLIAMPLAVAAAYGFVRVPARGKRLAYGLVVAVLLMPVVALAGAYTDLLDAFDVYGSRLALVPPTLVLTLPLAIWLSVTVLRDVPWTLLDAVRADGATPRQVLRHFAAPALLPGLAVVALLVFVAGCNDAVLGVALSPDERTAPLPATLLLATGQVADSSSVIAAAGLLWMLPAIVLLLLFPRRINHLLGRSYR
ncbi:ABC transporter permease subunit [Aeromicrobium sp. SMF47]|uniref:carbohydrate ABC transporter permease n=1 Tax=Aeromicrobium yanjiei TaxID=2662028 RepID=UPI00129E8066|nr:ABC transporter permease subunit [Aeromicrobium yanjiei]MRJ76577.1 ABC transporter permease subunit [Aeromicrobium yanjiei]